MDLNIQSTRLEAITLSLTNLPAPSGTFKQNAQLQETVCSASIDNRISEHKRPRKLLCSSSSSTTELKFSHRSTTGTPLKLPNAHVRYGGANDNLNIQHPGHAQQPADNIELFLDEEKLPFYQNAGCQTLGLIMLTIAKNMD